MKKLYTLSKQEVSTSYDKYSDQIVNMYIKEGSEQSRILYTNIISESGANAQQALALQSKIREGLSKKLGYTKFPAWCSNVEKASLEDPYLNPILDPLAERLSVMYRTSPNLIDRTLKMYKIQYNLSDDQIIELQRKVRTIGNLRYDYN